MSTQKCVREYIYGFSKNTFGEHLGKNLKNTRGGCCIVVETQSPKYCARLSIYNLSFSQTLKIQRVSVGLKGRECSLYSGLVPRVIYHIMHLKTDVFCFENLFGT